MGEGLDGKATDGARWSNADEDGVAQLARAARAQARRP
jgi:hypothetical protein